MYKMYGRSLNVLEKNQKPGKGLQNNWAPIKWNNVELVISIK